MSQDTPNDPLEFVRNMWNNMGFSLPGMVTPTLDVDELDKRIADMKAVEGWLKMNLNMLQMSIQGLEMQRATLAAIRAMGEATRRSQDSEEAEAAGAEANPFAAAALWPWLQAMQGSMAGSGAEETDSEPAAADGDSEPGADQGQEARMSAADAFASAAAAATNAAANAAMWPWQVMSEQAREEEAKTAAPRKKAPAAKRATTTRAKRPPATAAAKRSGGTAGATRTKATATASKGTATRKRATPRKKPAAT